MAVSVRELLMKRSATPPGALRRRCALWHGAPSSADRPRIAQSVAQRSAPPRSATSVPRNSEWTAEPICMDCGAATRAGLGAGPGRKQGGRPACGARSTHPPVGPFRSAPRRRGRTPCALVVVRHRARRLSCIRRDRIPERRPDDRTIAEVLDAARQRPHHSDNGDRRRASRRRRLRPAAYGPLAAGRRSASRGRR